MWCASVGHLDGAVYNTSEMLHACDENSMETIERHFPPCRRGLTVLVIWAAVELLRQLLKSFLFTQFASHDGHFEKLKVRAQAYPVELPVCF